MLGWVLAAAKIGAWAGRPGAARASWDSNSNSAPALAARRRGPVISGGCLPGLLALAAGTV
jgi:hypothetical protein